MELCAKGEKGLKIHLFRASGARCKVPRLEKLRLKMEVLEIYRVTVISRALNLFRLVSCHVISYDLTLSNNVLLVIRLSVCLFAYLFIYLGFWLFHLCP